MMRKLLELRTGFVHADGDEIANSPDTYTMCGLDTSALRPRNGKRFSRDEIEDDISPAMRITSWKITCPRCLSLAEFVLKNANEFKSAIVSKKGACDGK